jgi:Fe2+ or Zn2+ uptake regulation protein
MDTSYADTMRRHRRLTILRTLADAPGYASNESIIQQVLDTYRVSSTRDQVRTELTWLAEQGLLAVEDVGGVFMVATITQGGLEISGGKRVHPDIEKPAPRKS